MSQPDPSVGASAPDPVPSDQELREVLLDAAMEISLRQWLSTDDAAGRLVRPSPRTWLRPAASAAAALVLLSALGSWAFRREARQATWLEPVGSVVVDLPDGSRREVTRRLRMVEGARVLTLADRASIRLPEGTVLSLHPQTEVRRGAREWDVTRGTLDAQVKPRAPGDPLILRTPDAVATVLGTAFRLHVTPGESVLEVSEGEVEFLRRIDLRRQVVRNGQRAVVGPLAHTTADGGFRVTIYLPDAAPGTPPEPEPVPSSTPSASP